MSDPDDDLPTVTVENAKYGTLTVAVAQAGEIRVLEPIEGTIEIRHPWAP